jgi:hypothetical protein
MEAAEFLRTGPRSEVKVKDLQSGEVTVSRTSGKRDAAHPTRPSPLTRVAQDEEPCLCGGEARGERGLGARPSQTSGFLNFGLILEDTGRGPTSGPAHPERD